MHRPKLVMAIVAATAILVGGCAQFGEESDTETANVTSNSGAGVPNSGTDPESGNEVTNQDLAALSAVLQDQIPASTEQCVVDRLIGNRELVNSLIEGGPGTRLADRPLEDQMAVFELTTDCGSSELLGQYFSEGFAEEAGAGPPAEMTECVTTALQGDDGPLIMAGFLAIDNERQPPVETRTPMIDLLTECVPASYLAETVVDDAATDPQFDEALDRACVRDAYADPELARPLWEILVDNAGIDVDQIPPQTTARVFGPLFDCISFGQVVANEAAVSGVTISDSSIACFDERFISLGYVDLAFAGGALPEDQLGEILIECFTADELRQLGSS